MNTLQLCCVAVYGLISLLAFIKGIGEVYKRNNPFGQPHILFLLGIFVWGDALIFGFFWCLVSLISFLLKDWILFLLIIAVFWVVRSLGEMLYWINQQFSPIIRNPPKTLFGYHWLKNDSIWFVYQVFWQCLLVISIVTTIYLTSLWSRV